MILSLFGGRLWPLLWLLLLCFSEPLEGTLEPRAGIIETMTTLGGTMTTLGHVLKALVVRSFEGWRFLIKNANRLGFSALDPLQVPFSLVLRSRNPLIPLFGFVEITLSNMLLSGLATFETRSVDLDPLARTVVFEHIVRTMSASTDFDLKYYLFDVVPLHLSAGTVLGAIRGSSLKGTSQLYPDLGNWFKLSQLNMTYSFENIDFRVYPRLPINLLDADQLIENYVYSAMQKTRGWISAALGLSYGRSVNLRFPYARDFGHLLPPKEDKKKRKTWANR